VAAASAANAGSGGGGGGATLQLSCAKGCAVRGCNFTGNAAPGANGGGLLANVSVYVLLLGPSSQCWTVGQTGQLECMSRSKPWQGCTASPSTVD
jgi:hypothetical protein